MQFQHLARWCLMKARAYNGVSYISHGTILCSLCKRDCYLAYLNCDCCLHPICLRHEIKSVDSPCGGNYTVCLREDIHDMEAAAGNLEREEDITREALQQCRSGDDLSLLLKKFPAAEQDGYSPYCEINPDSDAEVAKSLVPESGSYYWSNLSRDADSVGIELSEASLSSVVSTLCSLRGPAENVSTPKNVLRRANFSLDDVASAKFSSNMPRNVNESSLASVDDSRLVGLQGSSHGLEVNAAVDQNSDESDSEIFRVKRRSSAKVEQRNAKAEISSNFDQQGLKRLKKLQPELKCGPPESSACSTTDHPKQSNAPVIAHSKENSDGASKDKFGRGTATPISTKFRKSIIEEASSRHREQHRDEIRIDHDLGRAREAPPLEIGPKRIKVRGLSFLGPDRTHC